MVEVVVTANPVSWWIDWRLRLDKKKMMMDRYCSVGNNGDSRENRNNGCCWSWNEVRRTPIVVFDSLHLSILIIVERPLLLCNPNGVISPFTIVDTPKNVLARYSSFPQYTSSGVTAKLNAQTTNEYACGTNDTIDSCCDTRAYPQHIIFYSWIFKCLQTFELYSPSLHHCRHHRPLYQKRLLRCDNWSS